VRIGNSIDESSCDRSEGPNDSIIPHGDNTGAIMGKANTSAVKVINHDAKQLLFATRRPNADALLAGGGKNTRVVP